MCNVVALSRREAPQHGFMVLVLNYFGISDSAVRENGGDFFADNFRYPSKLFPLFCRFFFVRIKFIPTFVA